MKTQKEYILEAITQCNDNLPVEQLASVLSECLSYDGIYTLICELKDKINLD
jgi:hypothetical protein